MGSPKQTHDLPLKIIIGWGLGTLPMAIYFNSFNFLALRFFTDTVGLTAATAGAIIGLSKLYDAVSDPLMGTISDRTRSPFGRRRLYILIGGVMCALSVAMLFSVPEGMSGQRPLIFTCIVVLLYATSYTVYNVPYMAMPAEISASSYTRSSMISWRVVAIGAGGLVAGAVGPNIIEYAGGGAEGHRAMGISLGVAILVFAVLTFVLTSGAPDRGSTVRPERRSLRESVETIIDNRPFLLLLGLKFFQLTGVAMSSATLAFFVVWVLGRSYGDLGTIVFFTTIGQIVGMPVWLRISRVIGKRHTFFVSATIFSIVSMTWLLASAAEPLYVSSVRAFLKGLATGGILLVGQALLPDTIEYDRLRTGQRREGVLTGLYTTIEKLSFAIGATLVGFYLDFMDYVPRLNPQTDLQSESAMTAIYYCQSVLPSLCMCAAALFLLAYRLDDRKLDELREGVMVRPSEA